MAVLDYAGLRRYDGKIKQYTGDLVDTVVEVTDTQPVDLYNKVWITPSSEDVELAEMSDVDKLKSAVSIGSQWAGKVWYAYGTSITNISTEGKYPTYLASMSGMNLVNKGISGGGIGNLGAYSTGQVYSAICNITDGKLNADLITLEQGANDVSENVPLGTIYDTGTETLAGCLNDCIRYLLENTTAQIVIMNSPYAKTMPTEQSQVFEWREMMRKICFLNGVHFIDTSCNLGSAKIDSEQGSLYVIDNIHQTDLGGYIFAQNIWYKLRNIPTFLTELPQ